MADDILRMIYPILDAAGLNAGANVSNSFGEQTGYVSPNYLPHTPEGRAWIDELVSRYQRFHEAGVEGYGLPGSTGGDINNLYTAIFNAAVDPSIDPALSAWINNQHDIRKPVVNTLARDQIIMADQLARDTLAAQLAAQKWETEFNAQLQRDLQAGLISHQQAMQAAQLAHEKAMQAEQLAFNYAELEWQKQYGMENIQLLRDRLAWDREYGLKSLGLQERSVAVQEGGLQLDRDRFALEKAIQEAMLRANPFNAVANALYTRGAQVPGGQTEYGQPTTTLDNSGTLPFLQQLAGGGIENPAGFGGSPLNSGGIGGNAAPNPNQISQRSFQNMSDVEQGITSSLAAYQGYNPSDYWKQMQRSWNTAGQGALNFATRLA